MKKYLLLLSCLLSISVFGQRGLTQEALRFPREKMTFEDNQVLLMNGRGYACPHQYGMTSFTNVCFWPINLYNYEFFLNFKEESLDLVIRDDVATQWKKWSEDREGWDPLACNFRSYAPKVLVTQDEEWQPNLYTRKATFHKEFKNHRWLDFSMKTATCVSGVKNEVLIKMKIYNRDKEALKLTLIPNQIYKEIKSSNPFLLNIDTTAITVSSTIQKVNKEGFLIDIPSKQERIYYFSVSFQHTNEVQPSIYQADIASRFQAAQDKIQNMLAWATSKLPQIHTENKQIDELYNRSILSVLMSRYERDDFVLNPFWAVGTWLFTISWDNSYASDIISMLDPESMKSTLRYNFVRGQMKRTYLSCTGYAADILYIQEPFAQQTMIDAYMNQTKDMSILTMQAGDTDIYGWMKRWAAELHDNYTNKMGLIDVGYSTEKIIEIRTDGYNHVVPIVNGLTVDLYARLSEWATLLGHKKEAKKYAAWADKLAQLMHEKLWNKDKRWFDNLYQDGSKGTVLSYHLFDLLATKHITAEEQLGLMSHIRENEFLGKFGFYSIAKNDTVHWDRIDGDWGGGGQYAGMPTRIARNLYKVGNAQLGWDVIKRYARYIDYFPYLSQNPSTDAPIQDRSSMPLQISAGAAAEALLFGTFGITPSRTQLSFRPTYHSDLGNCSVKNYHWGGHTYELYLKDHTFVVYQDGTLFKEEVYGERITVE